MIVRLWKTGLKLRRAEAYGPSRVFRRQEGFLGCVKSQKDGQGLVLTLWRDQEAVDALAHSPTYKATVERILAANLLAGEQSREVTDFHLLDFDPAISAGQ